jgi:hypothetical protein
MSQIGHCSLDPRVPPRSILKRHAKNEIDDRLHDARPTGASTMSVVPFTCDHFSVPSQEAIRCDQGMKFVQDLTSKSVRFSGEWTALGIGEANASPTQALREHAVLFLEIPDHVQLMALDPPGEHHEQQLKRLKRWGHCSAVYGLTNRRGSSSSRLAHCPIASFEFLDTTGNKQTQPTATASHPDSTRESVADRPKPAGGGPEMIGSKRTFSAYNWGVDSQAT